MFKKDLRTDVPDLVSLAQLACRSPCWIIPEKMDYAIWQAEAFAIPPSLYGPPSAGRPLDREDLWEYVFDVTGLAAPEIVTLCGPIEFYQDAMRLGLGCRVEVLPYARATETANAAALTGGDMYSVQVRRDGEIVGLWTSVEPGT